MYSVYIKYTIAFYFHVYLNHLQIHCVTFKVNSFCRSRGDERHRTDCPDPPHGIDGASDRSEETGQTQVLLPVVTKV